jgi:hypothetical protein
MDHRQRRRNNKISDEIRGLIIISMNNSTTANNVGHQFNVLPNTVRKIYSTYRRTQNTTKKKLLGIDNKNYLMLKRNRFVTGWMKIAP